MAKTRQNGEGSVYRRASDGLWIGSITLGWEGGKRKRKTVSAKTAEAVHAKLREIQRSVDAGLPVGDSKVTVDQLLDRWFNDVLRHQVASVALSKLRGDSELPHPSNARTQANRQASPGRDRCSAIGQA